MSKRPRVFGIGLAKTGTSSLHAAMGILGWKSCHYRHVPKQGNDLTKGDLVKLTDFDELFNAGSDLQVAANFEILESKYPNSLFVYTVRELNSWLESTYRAAYSVGYWRGEKKEPIHVLEKGTDRTRDWEKLYGVNSPIRFEREWWIASYLRHDRRVFNYFKTRKRKLLTMDICGGDGWKVLCEFLGVQVPKVAFPVKEVSAFHHKKLLTDQLL